MKARQKLLMRVFVLVVVSFVALSFSAPVVAQSGPFQFTVIFNADTRPAVPIYQSNPYPHEGMFVTCSGLGSNSSVQLQVTVNGVTTTGMCDVSIELHSLAGASVDISAQDTLGIGPIFHLLAYGLDAYSTPTPSIPTPTPPPCIIVASTVIGSHHQITFPASGFTYWNVDAYHWSVRARPGYPGLAADFHIWQSLGGTGTHSQVVFTSSAWTLIPTHGLSVSSNSYIPTGGQPFAMELCFADLVTPTVTPTNTPSPTPGGTLTPTNTLTPVNTPTDLPEPTLPPNLACLVQPSILVGAQYQVNATGDKFGQQVRAYPIPFEGYINIAVVLFSGTTNARLVNTGFQLVDLHTTSLRFTSSNNRPFSVQWCTVIAATTSTAVPTISSFATFTPSPTETSTGTLTPSPTQTRTNTPVPSNTPTRTAVTTCLTPAGEDTAECVIIGLQLTQIALQQTMAAPIPTPAALTPVITRAENSGSFSTVVAVACTKDPCYNIVRMNDLVKDSLTLFTAVDNSVCSVPSFPFAFGTGLFGIGNYVEVGFSNAVCWVIDITTSIRTIMRFLSVVAVFFMLYKYYIRTVRRLGDV